MPNGYTAKIYDGEPQSLRDYLMSVGRGFGFAILQRDDHRDDPVRPVQETTYYEQRLCEATERLQELDTLTVEEAHSRAVEDHQKALESYRESNERNRLMGIRYDDMIAQVQAWYPNDSRFDNLKEQALQYLIESRDFDVADPEQQARWNPYPKLLSGEEWIKREKSAIRKKIDFYTRQRNQEAERTAERNDWIDAFLKCLPAE